MAMQTNLNCQYLLNEFTEIEASLKQYLDLEISILGFIKSLNHAQPNLPNIRHSTNMAKIRSALLIETNMVKLAIEKPEAYDAWISFWNGINDNDRHFIIRVLKLKQLSKVLNWINFD